jgi:hypothetical protein
MPKAESALNMKINMLLNRIQETGGRVKIYIDTEDNRLVKPTQSCLFMTTGDGYYEITVPRRPDKMKGLVRGLEEVIVGAVAGGVDDGLGDDLGVLLRFGSGREILWLPAVDIHVAVDEVQQIVTPGPVLGAGGASLNTRLM